MSQVLIQRYFNDLDRIRSASGATRETVVREAFKDLLKQWGRQQDLVFIAEHEHIGPTKNRCYVDGALLHEIRVPFGYWEAKDTGDKLDEEIEKKKRKGYPQDNIIFEDSHQAVLIQDRQEVIRCEMSDAPHFEKLLSLFFRYERKEIAEFRKAVEQFKADLPSVLKALREKIEEAHTGNAAYKKAEAKFLKHAKETINPSLGSADVREMLIQHILTEEIFAKVFDESDFHTHNNIAKELYTLENTFFVGGLKRETLKALEPYYAAIRSSAAQITRHTEKQTFLKIIYENFYKVYNEKAADRLGVVYTPNEIVRFMIDGADWLCRRHFNRGLIDKNVEILDPATGTGTFITELIDYFRGDKAKLAHKYKEELHANEVAILPYYVANLNIEATYAALTARYEEFENLCFVDTLDNVSPLGHRTGHQHDLFASFTEENVKRVKRQNARKISVIIGNPPYNANQQSENDNNKNREYPKIDELIKDTYIKASSAQKTKVYDMYARFFRWASDRLDINGDGIIAFITNRSFIDRRTFDGFRQTVAKEFNEIWIVDLGGDVRANPKLSGTTHNVFGIQTGVAISFFVRKRNAAGCAIRYVRRPEAEEAADKLQFLASTQMHTLDFAEIRPDKRHSWINQTDNNYHELLPIADKATKAAINLRQERAVFKLYSLGISTNRDDWLYDGDEANLEAKVHRLISVYDTVRTDEDDFPDTIKWSETLKRRKKAGQVEPFDSQRVRRTSYRPFSPVWLYASDLMIDRPGLSGRFFPPDATNVAICFSDVASRASYCVMAVSGPADLHFGAAIDAYQQVARYSFTDGVRLDNITDWAFNRFRDHYEKGKGRVKRRLTKDDIFHYIYAVLHDPIYREKYGLNLKRELPRIPLYADFWQWASWGQNLMQLHLDYERADPFELSRVDQPDEKARAAGVPCRPILRSDRERGTVTLDTETTLTGIPGAAWDYVLGNRSALDWVLDQHKEKAPKDKTIRAEFNTYRFADHKDEIIKLLKRVVTVSVDTLQIIEAMRERPRDADATFVSET
jgi:predicted helicase